MKAYLDAVVDRLRDLLGDRLVGVYPTGSLALDGYRHGRSDVDLIAVAEEPPVQQLAAALSHEALPCPATGLEFVLYDRATLAGLTTGAGFALNLNTGRELPAKVETQPGGGITFWYPIDRDIAHQQGRVLTGPPFARLVPRVPYEDLLPVVADSVTEHLAGAVDDNSVLNGCRALRFYAEHRWSSKPAAAAWALRHAPAHAEVIGAAVDSHSRDRAAGARTDTARARAFLEEVLGVVRGT